MKNMFKFIPIIFFGSLTLTGAALKENRPNVVFVITDDQGYGDLGCTGTIDTDA